MKKLLIVVDYQKDFVTGTLGFEGAAKIEEAIYEKITEYRKNGQDIAFTLDTHYEDYSKTQEGRNLPIAHCIHDTEGWQLYGKIAQLQALKEEGKAKCFSKFTFGSIDLAKDLLGKDYDVVELVGVVTDICVISNGILVKAALPEAEIQIDANCVASNQIEMENKAFDIMENLHMKVLNRKGR
ncbi:MAG: cysteine hydrolase family protein [Anaerovorax sp.]